MITKTTKKVEWIVGPDTGLRKDGITIEAEMSGVMVEGSYGWDIVANQKRLYLSQYARELGQALIEAADEVDSQNE